jgi:hypothetical protein
MESAKMSATTRRAATTSRIAIQKRNRSMTVQLTAQMPRSQTQSVKDHATRRHANGMAVIARKIRSGATPPVNGSRSVTRSASQSAKLQNARTTPPTAILWYPLEILQDYNIKITKLCNYFIYENIPSSSSDDIGS